MVYCVNFFGYNPVAYGYNININTLNPSDPLPPPLDGSSLGSDGSVTMWNTTNNNGNVLSSVGFNSTLNRWVGIAFGCGAYIETRSAINPSAITDPSVGHPADWALAVEHLATLSGPIAPTEYWNGQNSSAPPIYAHYAENDYAEFFGLSGSSPEINTAPIDWWGINVSPMDECGSDGYCKNMPVPAHVLLSPSVNLEVYHTFGELWVPATSSGAQDGYIQAYMDEQPIGQKYSYGQYTNNLASPLAPTPTASFTATISNGAMTPGIGNIMNVSAMGDPGGSGAAAGSFNITVGQYVSGPGVPMNTTITAAISGSGGTGTYQLSTSSLISAESMFSASSWLFGVTDYNHMALMWGAFSNAPLTVLSVDVWQNPSTSCNITG